MTPQKPMPSPRSKAMLQSRRHINRNGYRLGEAVACYVV